VALIVAKGRARRNDDHLVRTSATKGGLATEDLSIRAALMIAATAACLRRRSTEMA
jgi:hypothetical protein